MADAPETSTPVRPGVALMLRHPAHLIALGAGSGLSPRAPGTAGTLWAWASFLLLQQWWGQGPQADLRWALLIGLGAVVGWWACTHTARSLHVADPGSIVWDEIIAFWLVLWLVMPVGWLGQLIAFGLFRWFDAVKPGPVRWADGLFAHGPGQPVGWLHGLGVMFDDLVAALCTLLVWAVGVAALRAFFPGGGF